MEIWKDIKGYKGKYQVSDLGRIKSLGRYVNCMHNKPRLKAERILISHVMKRNGYVSICLAKNGTKKSYRLHRIVCKAFMSNPERKSCVNHKNGIKTDNRAVNLEWCTPSENAIHAIKTGLNPQTQRCRAVCKYDLKDNFIESYTSQTEAAKLNGLCQGNISTCCINNKYTSGGFKWKYAK